MNKREPSEQPGSARASERVFGKYEGVVVDADDPLNIGRVRARVPAVLGEDVPSGWALPCAPIAGPKFGLLLIPSPGDTVWIEFANGDVCRPIWSGGFWAAPTSAGGPDDLASETGEELPVGDDDQPATTERLILRTRAGHRIVCDDEGGVVVIAAGSNSARIVLDDGGRITVEADTIELGEGASEALVLGDAFMDLFNQHTHGTGVGPSTAPTQPMTPNHLSSKVKTG